MSAGIVATGVLATVAGCASSHQALGVQAGGPTAPSGCPTGKPLPAGQGEAIDYVDMVKYHGHEYIAMYTPTDPAPKTGAQVFTVRCTASVPDDNKHGEVPVVEEGSTFVPAGAAVYEIAGMSAECGLAAMVDGKMHAYYSHGVAGCPAR
jgi:hypothetical protein